MKHLTIATRLTIMAVLPLAILLGISLMAWTGLRTDGAALTSLRADSEMSRLIGANRRYIDEVIPHIGSLMRDSVEDVLDGSGTVVIGLQTSEILTALRKFGTDRQFFLDLVGIPEPERLKGEYRGLCW